MAGINATGDLHADNIADAALRLAGDSGWRTLALGDIAAEAGLTLADLAGHYPCRAAILAGFERLIDCRMLAGAAAGDTGDSARDRLFDIIMERFEALAPYRAGIRRIARELPMDPQSAMVLACALPRSVAWMYSGARLAIDGPGMPIKLAALGGVYLSALRIWLTDDSQDLSKTMAGLDKRLDKLERLLSGFGRTKPAEPGPAEPTAPLSTTPIEPKAAPRRKAAAKGSRKPSNRTN